MNQRYILKLKYYLILLYNVISYSFEDVISEMDKQPLGIVPKKKFSSNL